MKVFKQRIHMTCMFLTDIDILLLTLKDALRCWCEHGQNAFLDPHRELGQLMDDGRYELVDRVEPKVDGDINRCTPNIQLVDLFLGRKRSKSSVCPVVKHVQKRRQ